MRIRHLERTALKTVLVAACVMLFVAAYAVMAHAQAVSTPSGSPNPSSPLTVPQSPETPVSPTTPGQPSQPGQDTTGLPPGNSVYGLNNQIPDTTSPGAC
jgi:hypothetical protein